MKWVDVVILAQPAILSGLNEEQEATGFAVAQMLLEWAVLGDFL